MNNPPGEIAPHAAPDAASDAALDRMQYRADPLADDTVARIVGAWPATSASASASATAEVHLERNHAQWQRLDAATRAMSQWQGNAALAAWPPDTEPAPPTPPDMVAALQAYLHAARALPDWADAARIEQAERIFFDYGALSCVLLFCASLPECYVVPDLAEVLHTTGQLEQRAEYRIRSTAAMVFPVMMAGGLTAADGGGVAQVLKVRLIHATVRNLILRGEPQAAVAALAGELTAGHGVVPPLEALRTSSGMHRALYAHGWKLGEDGLPCNQEELAYTLLTFGFVFLRGLRTLGLRLSRSDEEAYLHAWNVVGHLLGIERELMADTMHDAAALFARMQARGRADPVQPDPRPALGRTLMQTMSQVIPLGVAKPFPVLMTRLLCGPITARDLGLDAPVPWLSRALFALGLHSARAIDAVVRLAVPRFSLVRFATRVLGYHLITRLLMDQTRPLKLPEQVRTRVAAMMSNWGDDPRAPRWLNRVEDRFTTAGQWTPPAST